MPIKKILVVDDEIFVRKMVENILGEQGYDVDSAENAEACLDQVRMQKPDAILMDIMMPGKTGWDAIEDLKREGFGDVPVVMLTARSESLVKDKKRLAGVKGYITKPFESDELVGRLETLLHDQEHADIQ